MRYAEHVADLIGHTPLVRLNHVVPTGPDAPLVLAKVEYFNPGGSVKDRIAVKMIDAAEASGALQPGGTIVEPTSGNTGVGLAIVAQQRGYHCIFVVPDKVSEDKQRRAARLRRRGRRVPRPPSRPTSPESYYSVSDRLARETDGGWKPDQYSNPANPQSTTRPPAPRSGTRPTAGSRTSSPASAPAARSPAPAATSRRSPSGRVQVVGADPEGSVYSGGAGRPYLVEGVGEDFWPTTYDRGRRRRDRRGLRRATPSHMTRRLAREEGAAGRRLVRHGRRRGRCEVAARLGPDDVVVVLLPDGGRGYLSKIFNDDWMAAYGFLDPGRRRARPSATCCAARPARSPTSCTPTRTRPSRDAIDDPPRVRRLADAGRQRRAAGDGGEVRRLGRPSATCSTQLFNEQAALDRPGRAAHVAAAAAASARSEPLSTAVQALARRRRALVLVDGKPPASSPAHDLLAFLARAAATTWVDRRDPGA